LEHLVVTLFVSAPRVDAIDEGASPLHVDRRLQFDLTIDQATQFIQEKIRVHFPIIKESEAQTAQALGAWRNLMVLLTWLACWIYDHYCHLTTLSFQDK
jgi:hypothetical protein